MFIPKLNVKIKDEVNLEELKKYGFEEYSDSYILRGDFELEEDCAPPFIVAIVHKNDKSITLYDDEVYYIDDLVGADLVEFLPIEISEEERRLSR